MPYKKINLSLLIILILNAIYLLLLGIIFYLNGKNPDSQPPNNLVGAFTYAFASGLAIALILSLSYACFMASAVYILTIILILFDLKQQKIHKNNLVSSVILIALIVMNLVFGISLLVNNIIAVSLPLLLQALTLTIYLTVKFKYFKSNLLKQI